MQLRKREIRKYIDLEDFKKDQKLVKDKPDNPSLQYTPTEQSLVTHVGESIRKFKEKVTKLEEAQ